jgi:hypothetical protein
MLLEDIWYEFRCILEDITPVILPVGMIVSFVILLAWGTAAIIRWRDEGQPTRTERIELVEKRIDVLNDRVEYLEMKSNQTK